MKSPVLKTLSATLSLGALLAAGCVSHEVKSTDYVPPAPVAVVPAPSTVVVTSPPVAAANAQPDVSSTSQTTESYNSTSSDSASEPGSDSSSTTYRQHSESSTVKSVPAPAPPRVTIYQEHDYQVATPGAPVE
jgi:hypothetical protein